MRVLVLGASGMLGNAMFFTLAMASEQETIGTVRSATSFQYFPARLREQLLSGVDVEKHDLLVGIMAEIKPDVVINCIGITNHQAQAKDLPELLSINAQFPHRLAQLCRLGGSRLIHVSTDCVFPGERGAYREDEATAPQDLYGKTKLLGEIRNADALTLRTSFIGHSLADGHHLADWFLSQEGQVKGYSQAIFSGLTTIELARLVRDVIIPRGDLAGIYHVAAQPISKFELLKLIAQTYGKSITVVPDDTVVINRSLNAERFHHATGYIAPSWPDMIRQLFESRNISPVDAV